MNFDSYFSEGIELNDEGKRVKSHYLQNRSLEWAIKDRNRLQFDVIKHRERGFTNVYGGTRLRYWESGFQQPEADCFFVVGVFYDPEEIYFDRNGVERKRIKEIAIRQYGKDRFDQATEYANDLKKVEGADFTNVFAGTKLRSEKQDDGSYTYVVPEAA